MTASIDTSFPRVLSICRKGREGSPLPAPRPGIRAFTLIELILVMAILSTVLAVAAPSLGRFFRGRNLDSEANRLVALTRHGQDRAAAEGIPMLLWFDTTARRYGLQADTVWTKNDGKSVGFDLAEDLEIDIRQADLSRTNGTLEVRENTAVNRPTLRFMPDGTFGPSSPEWIELHGRSETGEQDSKVWIALGWNRLNYEVWTRQPPLVRQ